MKSILFGGYQVEFSDGAEPVYLHLSWPVGTDPQFVHITRQQAKHDHRKTLAELDFIAVEEREHKGIVFKVELYGKPGCYTAQKSHAIVEWPEEI